MLLCRDGRDALNKFKNGHQFDELYINKTKILRELKQIADNEDDKDANYLIACCLLNGICCVKNLYNAIIFAEKAGKLGSIDAYILLAKIFSEGIKCKKDIIKAKEYYQSAKKLGYKGTLNGLDIENNINADNNSFIESTIIKAQNLYIMGIKYQKGDEVPRNLVKAIECFEEASKLGNLSAKYELAYTYYLDEIQNLDMSYSIAKQFYDELKINNSNSKIFAAINSLLGCIHIKENTKFFDAKKAISYFEKAGELGDGEGFYELGRIYDQGIFVERNESKAIENYSKASSMGYDWASYNLGLLYLKIADNSNKGLMKKAFDLFVKAYKQGDKTSVINIAHCYLTGTGVNKNEVTGFNLYLEASKLFNDPVIFFNLAICYFNGYGTEINFDKALKNFKIAASLNHPEANYILGVLLRENKYKLDISKENRYNLVKSYFEKAYDLGYLDVSDDLVDINNKINEHKLQEIFKFGNQKDVFISWNHNNLDIKNMVRDYLRDNGIDSIWESDENANGQLDDVISLAINNTNVYVFLLTGDSVQSKWVEQEAKLVYENIQRNQLKLNVVVPVIINVMTENGIYVACKTRTLIADNSYIYKLINNMAHCYSEFDGDPLKNNDDWLSALKRTITSAIDNSRIIEYLNKTKEDNKYFKAGISSSIRSEGSSYVSTMLSFDDYYINRRLIDINGIILDDYNVILENKVSFIYGEGGIGKSLFVKKLIADENKNNRIVIYVKAQDLKNDLNSSYDILSLIKKHGFDKLIKEELSISLEGFKSIFIADNDPIIVVDALDEIDNSSRLKLIDSLATLFKKLESVKLVLTSRNSDDADELNGKLTGITVNSYKLDKLSDDDMNLLFDKLFDNYMNQAKAYSEMLVVSKSDFKDALSTVSDDIKRNPLLLTSLIYIYVRRQKILNKKFYIIKESNDILVKNLEKEANIDFKYKDLIKGDKLSKLLGFISILRANNDIRELEVLIKAYLKLTRYGGDLDDASESINKYLYSRRITDGYEVTHEIFRGYYAATKLFDEYIEADMNQALVQYYRYNMDKHDGLLEYFNNYFKLDVEGNTGWLEIATDFVLKLDFEISAVSNNKSDINDNNPSYELYDSVLNYTKSFNEEIKETILGLAEENLLYYNDFVKKYIR